MLQFFFDTDHVTLLERSDPRLLQRLAPYPPDAVGVSAVTVEEGLKGRLAALSRARDGAKRILHYRLLLETVALFGRPRLVPYDQAAENQFQQLKLSRIRIGTQDLKIAAVALVNNVTLLTRNRRDFGRVPGLAIDNWSV